MKRVVLKVGTQVLVDSQGGFSQKSLGSIVNALTTLKAKGFEVALVTSGAVGLGRISLGLTPPLTLAQKQACASVGQGKLMRLYDEALAQQGLSCGQILLTSGDLSNRVAFLNLREMFEELLKLKVVPVINENDSVSVAELKESEASSFGDNDKLSSIVASKIHADILVIVSNVDGIYEQNPKVNPNARRLGVIEKTEDLAKVETLGTSQMGRGGMSTKIEASRMASLNGVATLITNLQGLEKFAQEFDHNSQPSELSELGTVVLPHKQLRGKKQWIGTASGYKASVVINTGALQALLERGASLLAVGVVSHNGEFEPGQVLSVRNESGHEVARGLSRLSSHDLASDSAKQKGVLIHRDELAIFASKEDL